MLQFETARDFNKRWETECWHAICAPHAAADRYHVVVYRCLICYALFEDVHCSIPGGDDITNQADISCAYTKGRVPMEYVDLSNTISELPPIPSVMNPNELADAVLAELVARDIDPDALTQEQFLLTVWEIGKELSAAR